MNAIEEIQMLKDRVSVLERLVLSRVRHSARPSTRDQSEIICEEAKRFISGFFNLTTKEMNGPSRTQRIVWPRWIAIHLAYKYSGAGQVVIAGIFNRDHGSVANALTGVQQEMQTNAHRRLQVQAIETEFSALLQPPTINPQLSTTNATPH